MSTYLPLKHGWTFLSFRHGIPPNREICARKCCWTGESCFSVSEKWKIAFWKHQNMIGTAFSSLHHHNFLFLSLKHLNRRPYSAINKPHTTWGHPHGSNWDLFYEMDEFDCSIECYWRFGGRDACIKEEMGHSLETLANIYQTLLRIR
jgi:hypothetical protein